MNRRDDRTRGRVAYVVYRVRDSSRTRSIAVYHALRRFAEQRRRHGRGEPRRGAGTDTSDEIDAAEPVEPDPGDAVADGRPDDSWTKGEIYELARELDIEGRSKLNKADLLEIVLGTLEQRNGPSSSADDVSEGHGDETLTSASAP